MVVIFLFIIFFFFIYLYALQDLEEQLTQLQIELQSRDDLVAATEQDMRKRNKDVAELEKTLTMKDAIIR